MAEIEIVSIEPDEAKGDHAVIRAALKIYLADETPKTTQSWKTAGTSAKPSGAQQASGEGFPSEPQSAPHPWKGR